ncbi:MAG: ABC transporter substrate-binding protein, partial [Acidimicrobiia bacterium]
EELPSLRNGGLRIADDGGVIVRYDIREGAQWADGTPISGEDFLFTYQTVMDPALPTDKSGFDAIVADAIVVNPKSFIFKLAAPSPDAATAFRYIIPKHDVAGSDFATDWNDTMWVSGGPFRFQEWRLGDSLTLVRNDAYWESDPATGRQLPYLDEVMFRFLPETASLIEALQAGDVQTARVPPADDLLGALAATPAVVTQRAASTIYSYLLLHFGGINSQHRPQTPHPDVMSSWFFRAAMAHSVDREALAAVWGDALPITGLLDVAAPAWGTPGWSAYAFDPEEARRLIEHGCEFAGRDCRRDPPQLNLFTFSNNPRRVAVARTLESMLEDVGFAVTLTEFSAETIFGYSFCDEVYDVALGGNVNEPTAAGLVAQLAGWDPAAPCPDGGNFAKWGTPDSFDRGRTAQRYFRLLDVIRHTADPDSFRDMAAAAEAILADHVDLVPLYARPSYAASRPGELSGFVHNPFGVDTWNIARWFRPDL